MLWVFFAGTLLCMDGVGYGEGLRSLERVVAVGSLALTRGWQTFAHARGLSCRCTLHFKFDGDATLFREGVWGIWSPRRVLPRGR